MGQPNTTTKEATTKNNANSLDQSDDSDAEQTKDNKSKTKQNGSNSPNNETNVFADAEKMKKLQKKMQNYKRKQKKKKKKKKPKPIPQQSVNSSKKNKDSDSSSDSSEDDIKKPKNKKMQTYEERMKTDNDILFKGHRNPQPEMQDDRVMLSGEVTLKNFPLGSSRDCENLAGQVSALLDQKLFEDQINANDVFLFYKKLLSANIIDKLDMVDTKALATKMNGILTSKQKARHTKKKKPKPQWIVSNKFGKSPSKRVGQHVDGGY